MVDENDGGRPSALNTQHATVVVELTPLGRGAVSVVLVAGRDAVRAVGKCFTSTGQTQLVDAAPGRILVGRWGGPTGEELVVCRRGDAEVEVHCHGGLAAVAAVTAQLAREGCRQITWPEWVRQAESGPIRAAAKIALAEAPTARAAAILFDQFEGALEKEIRRIAAAVASGQWPVAGEALEVVLAHRELGRHLTRPWRVVLTGSPNVGKSSLVNALAGYERSIVAPMPGTTRDVVTTMTAIEGWPVELADTAGQRESGDALEAAGIALADAALAGADLVMIVEDATESAVGADSLVARLPTSVRVIRVRNKIDLISEPPCLAGVVDEPARSTVEWHGVLTSAVTGEGIQELLRAIACALVPQTPAAGDAVAFTDEQVCGLEKARAGVIERDAKAALSALQALLAGGSAVNSRS